MHIVRLLVQTILAVSIIVAVGCSDDSKCTGHGCPGVGSFDIPEGGEIRMELNSYADGTSNINMQAFFFKTQTPPARPLAGQVIAPGCEDWTGGNIFDNGDTPAGQTIADSREYVDVGQSFRITRDSTQFTLTKNTDTDDRTNLLRHDVIYLENDHFPTVDGATLRQDIVPNARYSLDGLPFVPEDGVDPLGNAVEGVNIYLPADWATTSPTISSSGTEPNITLANGQDSSWTWETAPEGSLEQGLVFIAFLDDNFQVTHQCLGEDNGSLNIPSSVVNVLPTSGFIIHGKFVHHAYAYPAEEENFRRLDLLAINCHFYTFAKQ